QCPPWSVPVLERRARQRLLRRSSSRPNYATCRRHKDAAFVPLGAHERLRAGRPPCAEAIKLAMAAGRPAAPGQAGGDALSLALTDQGDVVAAVTAGLFGQHGGAFPGQPPGEARMWQATGRAQIG